MDIDTLRKRFPDDFPDEDACRKFFEAVLWKQGRYCPRSYA